MIFLGAFFAVAVGDPFPGRFRFPNKESSLPVYEEKVYDGNPLVNSANFYHPTTKRWKKTDGQPNVVLKAAPDVLLDRNDHKHSFTRNQMNNDDIWETPNHKKILEPGFRTPPKIPLIGLPVNIPASTPSMSKKEFLKAQRLKRKHDRQMKFHENRNLKPSIQLKNAPSFLWPQKVEPK